MIFIPLLEQDIFIVFHGKTHECVVKSNSNAAHKYTRAGSCSLPHTDMRGKKHNHYCEGRWRSSYTASYFFLSRSLIFLSTSYRMRARRILFASQFSPHKMCATFEKKNDFPFLHIQDCFDLFIFKIFILKYTGQK